jgi:hypothetical protein
VSVDEKVHALELRLQAAESRHNTLKSLLVGALSFLRLGRMAGWYNLYQRMLDEAQETRAEIALSELEAFKAEAARDVSAIKAQLETVCDDPDAVDKYGFCIFHANPGRYSLTYGAAAAYCAARGARLCTLAEVSDAQSKGAEWCSWGWVEDMTRGASNFDTRGTMAFPMQSARDGCGQKSGIITRTNINVLQNNAGANCCI